MARFAELVRVRRIVGAVHGALATFSEHDAENLRVSFKEASRAQDAIYDVWEALAPGSLREAARQDVLDEVLEMIGRNLENVLNDKAFRRLSENLFFRAKGLRLSSAASPVETTFLLGKSSLWDTLRLARFMLTHGAQDIVYEAIESAEQRLRRLIPSQKIAPAQFEIVDGRLKLAKASNKTLPADAQNASNAKEVLIASGNDLVHELAHSNCDKRLLASVQTLQDHLSHNTSVVALGLAAITCAAMHVGFKDELPTAVGAMLDGYIKGVQLFVGQFPDWTRFLENAAEAALESQDISHTQAAVNDFIRELAANDELVDPEVPRVLKYINEMLKEPGKSRKRAAYAMITSVSNLVSSVYQFGIDYLGETKRKTLDGLTTATAKVVVMTLLGLGVAGGIALTPVAGKVEGLSWIKNATEIVKKQLEKMAAE